MNEQTPALTWASAWRASVPWLALAMALTGASAAAANYYVLGPQTPLSGTMILIWSALTGTFCFTAVALVAGLSRRSLKVLLLVAAPWFALSFAAGTFAVGYLLFFATPIRP